MNRVLKNSDVSSGVFSTFSVANLNEESTKMLEVSQRERLLRWNIMGLPGMFSRVEHCECRFE